MSLDLYDDSLALVITTESDYDNARNLSNHILRMELSKCVSLSKIESIYWWEGSFQESQEVQYVLY